MNRVEFMSRLEELLAEIPAGEREEAITYYNDYFNDAGVENEQEVLDSLISPERVADTIKAGLGGKDMDGDFTEIGYRSKPEPAKEEVIIPKQEAGKQKDYSKQRPNENTVLKVILYVLIAVLLSPLWLPLMGGLFGILVAVLAVIAVAIFCLTLIPFIAMIVGIVLLLAGVFTFVVGLIKMFAAPAAAVGLLGIGLLLSGFGILFTVLGGWILVKVIPLLIRGIVNLLRKPFTRKRGN